MYSLHNDSVVREENARFSTTIAFAERIWQFEIIDSTIDEILVPTSVANWLIVVVVFILVMICTTVCVVRKYW